MVIQEIIKIENFTHFKPFKIMNKLPFELILCIGGYLNVYERIIVFYDGIKRTKEIKKYFNEEENYELLKMFIKRGNIYEIIDMKNNINIFSDKAFEYVFMHKMKINVFRLYAKNYKVVNFELIRKSIVLLITKREKDNLLIFLKNIRSKILNEHIIKILSNVFSTYVQELFKGCVSFWDI